MASDPIETAINAVVGAFAGGAYGFIIFARKRESTKRENQAKGEDETEDEIEGFDLAKLIPTVVVAALLGAVDGAASGPEAITIGGIATRLATYGGVIFALEQVYKLLRDRYRNAKASNQSGGSNDSPTVDETTPNNVDAPNRPTEDGAFADEGGTSESSGTQSADLTTGADSDPSGDSTFPDSPEESRTKTNATGKNEETNE